MKLTRVKVEKKIRQTLEFLKKQKEFVFRKKRFSKG